MMSTFYRFIFPKVCLYCGDLHEGNTLFCLACCQGIDFLSPRERCIKCFRSKYDFEESLCLQCRREAKPFYRKGIIFEKNGPVQFLYSDSERFKKEISAFFLIQMGELHWPMPDFLYSSHSLKEVQKLLSKQLGIPEFTKRKDPFGKVIYYLNDEGNDIPQEILGAKVYLLSYVEDDVFQ